MTNLPRVLFVDDNVNLLNGARRVSRGRVDMIIAESAAQALEILDADDTIEIVVSDQNMPAMKGVEFLAEVARRWPLVVRIMQTGNDDQATAMAAINSGQVFRFVRKPYETEELLQTIADAAALYAVKAEEKRLLETTLAGSIKLMTDLMTLTRPDLFEKSARVHQLAILAAKSIKVPHHWELELAAMLYPLGLVAVPEVVSARYAANLPLSPKDQLLIDQSTLVSADLLRNIPRLENVANIVGLCHRGFDGSGSPTVGPRGNDLPVVSRLLHILINLVDLAAAKKLSNADALDLLRLATKRYDNAMLQTIANALGAEAASAAKAPIVKKEVTVTSLRNGNQVAQDVLSNDGRLLLAEGSILTDILIQRLVQFARAGDCNERLLVYEDTKEQ
ncbi:HD domain-containing phosphohydrolase [Devosia sp.]|uniref:HD domain-containing phosphohydrolase n=1 Tax=Devosia sp. TaxID=1871048 RepID=UPI00326433ED